MWGYIATALISGSLCFTFGFILCSLIIAGKESDKEYEKML